LREPSAWTWACWELGEGDEGIWRDEICDRLLAADAPPMGRRACTRTSAWSVLAPVVALDLDVNRRSAGARARSAPGSPTRPSPRRSG
jgi:hypothetical protein